jgi:aminoglycoside 3'-phosphotransferase I
MPPSLDSFIAGERWTEIDSGESGGRVFRIGDNAFLKYGEGRVFSDIVAEHCRLVWLQGRIAAPRVLHFAATGEAVWLLTSALPGRMVEEVIEDRGAPRAAIVDAVAEFLRTLHALGVEDCPFDASHPVGLADARRNISAGLVAEDDFDAERAGWTAEQVWDALHAEMPSQFDRVVTHGDFSTGNIFVDADGRVTGMIDVGRLGVADRYQDLAILWNNLEEIGLGAQLLHAYGETEPDMARLRFHLMLDELF